ncbi:GNAT family N-acetyltransferase [Inhella sp.]|uniref:GNAT family N-acetyltransferase n=1 Tax=Inhella sp. TaxID=1921806 RepID=UPI0035B2C90D
MKLDIQHLPGQQRFEGRHPSGVCELDYVRQGQVLTFTHTGTPPALRGQGLAAQVVEAGLQWAREQGCKVVPACSYVALYLQRHPEWNDLQA